MASVLRLNAGRAGEDELSNLAAAAHAGLAQARNRRGRKKKGAAPVVPGQRGLIPPALGNPS
jgi:hypothetical protein